MCVVPVEMRTCLAVYAAGPFRVDTTPGLVRFFRLQARRWFFDPFFRHSDNLFIPVWYAVFSFEFFCVVFVSFVVRVVELSSAPCCGLVQFRWPLF